MSSRDAYRESGVDIEAGDEVVDRIGKHVKSTYRPGVIGDLGGFGGLFSLMGRYRDPVLVSGTDGVGTKLLLAQQLGRHETIGQDLVGMCVNDVVVCGAEPLFFLDYFATGKLTPAEAEQVIAGVAAGCRLAGCALIGGETAEMPGMYKPGHYDLAGFCVGAVERERIIDPTRIKAGDVLVGLPSSGPHSNGYSLIRKLIDGLDLAQEHGCGRPLADALMEPTRIYVKDLLALHQADRMLGAAHITGGGFTGNVPRMFPPGIGAVMRKGSWPMLPVFELLRERGELSDAEMFRTFNSSLGMVLTVRAVDAEAVAAELGGYIVGETVNDPQGECQVA